MADIKITITRGDAESQRIERLKLVAAEARERKLPILALHDHQGVLEVNWRRRPQTRQLLEAMQIWAGQGQEAANHYIRGRLLLSDTFGDGSWPSLGSVSG